ncbi:MAG TPA: carotenoid biosynthesis protein [bacterium]|nr:carotenoid biosynthesis protein [bacterium]
METLFTTVLHRPYVFLFLLSFLVIGILNRGPGRTLLFLTLGFSIAFLSEVSSIRNGFPYGMYHYVYENLRGELMLWGVPLWDSLSYSFLAYAAYEYGDFFWRVRGGDSRIATTFIAALLMVAIDVVVDPLAVQGERWFLGRIFYYPDGGEYFGVPLTNFGGWLLVALAILSGYGLFERLVFRDPPPRRAPWLGPAFYWGILAFNFAITFWIGEWKLGLIGLGLHLAVLAALVRRLSAPSSPPRRRIEL